MDRDEHVGIARVGDGRPLLERHRFVPLARHHRVEASRLHFESQASCDIERHELLRDAVGARGAVARAAVARIDGDLANPEAEHAR